MEHLRQAFSKNSRHLIVGLSILILSASALYLVSLHARGAVLAVAVASVVYLYMSFGGSKRGRIFCSLACLSILVATIFYLSHLNADPVKQGNWNYRVARWKNTIQMIRENPLGVGAGNFEFAYPAYRMAVSLDAESSEQIIIKQPHNGYLQVAAEYGLGVFSALTVLFFIFISRCASHIRSDLLLLQELAWAFALLIFVAVDALVAFPLSLAFPSFSTAIAIAWVIVRMGAYAEVELGRMYQRLAISAAVFLGAFELLRIGSLGVALSAQGNLDRIRVACSLYPFNWLTCLDQAEVEVKSGLAQEALVTTSRILNRHPGFYPALRVLTAAQIQAGDYEGACASLKSFEKVINQTTWVHTLKEQICSYK